jgi:hypothetical protein
LSQSLPQLIGHYLRLLNVLERISRPICEPLYGTNISHRKQETFHYEYPLHWVLLHTKAHNSTLLFGSAAIKHGRHFDYWNQPLNMRMGVCYLDCHEAGLCCYLMIYIANLLHPIQLFCFHLRLIYWLSFAWMKIYLTFLHSISFHKRENGYFQHVSSLGLNGGTQDRTQ